MYKPTLEEATNMKEDFKVIPLSHEIYSDIKTPVEVLKILKKKSRHCYLLESLESPERWGRYTFLGFDPRLEITCTDGLLKVAGDKTIISMTSNPCTEIRQILKDHRSPRLDYLPPFTGGLVGYFSYDFIKYSEPTLQLDAEDQDGFKDVDLMLFDKVIAFDNFRQKIVLIVNIKTENLEDSYKKGMEELNELSQLIRSEDPLTGGSEDKLANEAPMDAEQPGKIRSDFRQLFSKDEYCHMVEQAKDHIREGDIFQVVLSNRLEADFEGSLLNAYRVLRATNPSPYMFYFSSDDMEIAGASPETLVKLEGETLYTFPLAGTRPRGKTREEDLLLEKELLSDEKEIAEHNMLVDLGRNDLGRISNMGSVTVEQYMSIERYSHVMHIGSTVKGVLAEGKDALDAIEAVLPAGTLSGAPKIRACQIINQLENNKRGIYGGAIGYIDFTGNMDTCIAIRIAYKKNGKVFIRTGAGIVADSVPEKEYQECVNKSMAVIQALQTCEDI